MSMDMLQKLKRVYNIGKKISIIENEDTPSSFRVMIIDKIMEKLLLHDKSIISLLEISKENEFVELDLAAIGSLARNIMEAANLYFHFAERKISAEEIEFRYKVLSLNHETNLKELSKKLDFTINYGFFDAETVRNIMVNSIKEDKGFQKLDRQTQNHILSGRKPTYNRKDIGILEKDVESGLYNIFSSSIHSLYMGLGTSSIRHSFVYNGKITGIMILELSIEIAVIYTAHVLKDYLNLRKRYYNYLSDNEKTDLKILMCCANLDILLDSYRDQFSKSKFEF